MSDKALMYVDVNNLFFIYKKLDYVSLANFVKEQYDMVRMIAYNAIDHTLESQLKFNTYLSNNGFKVIDPNVNVLTNCDNMIITDMISDSNRNFDHKVVVICSCDGGFAYSLNELSKRGYIIHVIGSKKSTSSNLLNVCDTITYLEDIPGVIC